MGTTRRTKALAAAGWHEGMDHEPRPCPEGLPCPFCGATPHIQFWHGGPRTKRMISCGNDDCDVAPMVSGNTEAQALEHWNRRVPAGASR